MIHNMLTQQISGVLLTNNPYQVTAHFYSSPTTVNPYVGIIKEPHQAKTAVFWGYFTFQKNKKITSFAQTDELVRMSMIIKLSRHFI